MATTREGCDCSCHEETEDQNCCCCPATPGWEATCEGQAHTVGGHTKCKPNDCELERPRMTREEWLADKCDYLRDMRKDPDER